MAPLAAALPIIGNFAGNLISFFGQQKAYKKIASAIRYAVDRQMKWLEESRSLIQSELDPGKVVPMVLNQDIENAKRRLTLQQELDPALAAARVGAQTRLNALLEGPGVYESVLGDKPFAEKIGTLKGLLADEAIKLVKQGAQLPSDVQAELVKAGLEKAGQAGVNLSGRGLAGQNVRQVIGTAGLQLQQQRQQQAAQLGSAAQQLEERRSRLLGDLFGQEAAVSGQVAQLADQLAPSAGLSGHDLLNLLLSRVQANVALNQQAGEIEGKGAMALGRVKGEQTAAFYGGIGNMVKGAFSAGGMLGSGGVFGQEGFGGFLTNLFSNSSAPAYKSD